MATINSSRTKNYSHTINYSKTKNLNSQILNSHIFKKTGLFAIILLFSTYSNMQACCIIEPIKAIIQKYKEKQEKDKLEKLQESFFREIDLGHLDKVKEFDTLIDEKKIDINGLNSSNKTPIWFACQQRKVDIVKYLITKKANVNCICNGASPLYWSFVDENEDLLKILCDNGAKMDDTVIKYLKKIKKESRQKFIKIIKFEKTCQELVTSKPCTPLFHTPPSKD